MIFILKYHLKITQSEKIVYQVKWHGLILRFYLYLYEIFFSSFQKAPIILLMSELLFLIQVDQLLKFCKIYIILKKKPKNIIHKYRTIKK